MSIVKALESHVVQDVLIAQKVHPVSSYYIELSARNNSFFQRIIGGRGAGVRALMKRFGVEIKVSYILDTYFCPNNVNSKDFFLDI